MVSLAAGILGGLQRVGLSPGNLPSHATEAHGVLMVCGFFGTLISLERAVALGATWAYAAPAASALGGLAFLMGEPIVGAGLLALSGIALAAASLAVHRRQPATFVKVLAAGACCWMTGSVLLACGAPMPRIEPWWMGFFLLTIAGERLELNRLSPPRPRARRWFVLIASVLMGALAVQSLFEPAVTLFAFALGTMGVWLIANDVARYTVRSDGLPRYIAFSLLAGYGWLLAAASAGILQAAGAGGPLIHDAWLHAMFLGFVFSMVFGHAPIILPALLARQVRHSSWLYAPLVLLHVAVAVRIGGDLALSPGLRLTGSVLAALAIVFFVAAMLVIMAGRRMPQIGRASVL